ncbi:hypothetical protein U3A58_21640 [Algoriphagus sp. C2-6-M1]|uniref:hypothetical protein n=1 Tax=Algoriphagus persicinus TaxID=3108754 RepID=UPI002B387CD5|nr:hypothetical protein [Algoriphagus sp. C2-6-M1]MEB2782992.1 hypothetical protein [Algoriphagus sp. C2-6-M1]
MKNRLLTKILSLTLWTLLFSCEGVVRGTGKVISSLDKLPIDSVRIKWGANETFTDSLGHFEIGEFVGCPTGCPDLELVLTKVGYETRYVNVTEENQGLIYVENITIELNQTDKVQADIWNNKVGDFLYYSSMTIAGLGLITLVMLLLIKVDNRLFWFFLIFFGTVGFHYNFLADIYDFKILRPVTHFNPPHKLDPAWYKLSLPLGTIAFWIYYFKRLRKKIVDLKTTHNITLDPAGGAE